MEPNSDPSHRIRHEPSVEMNGRVVGEIRGIGERLSERARATEREKLAPRNSSGREGRGDDWLRTA